MFQLNGMAWLGSGSKSGQVYLVICSICPDYGLDNALIFNAILKIIFKHF